MSAKELLVQQVSREVESGLIYRFLSNWCSVKAFVGSADFFARKEAEEFEHADDISQFLADKDIFVDYAISFSNVDLPLNNLFDCYKMFYDHEIVVSGLIGAIDESAKEEDNKDIFAFVQKYVTEQVEEVGEAKTMLDQIERIKDDQAGIFSFDTGMVQIEEGVVTLSKPYLIEGRIRKAGTKITIN